MILSYVIATLRAWRRYRVCVRELSLLNDRELADIGLTRSGIHAVAWRSAQGLRADNPAARVLRDGGSINQCWS